MAIKTYRDGRTKLTGIHYMELRWSKYSAQEQKCAMPPEGCGRPLDLKEMELHHLKGRGMMGSKRDDTMQATVGLCKKCHYVVTPKPMWRKRGIK